MSAGDSRPPSDDSSPSSSTAERSEAPSSSSSSPSGRAAEDESIVSRFLHAESGPLLLVRETLTSVAAVAAVGLLLFAISGVWPPMVAVESGSMQPHMQRGDLVFITEPGRFAPDAAQGDTGVVTYAEGRETGYRSFGSYGSVVIYDQPNQFGPPIIHRARFWVDDGENWYGEANQSYVRADSCAELANCPAPHAGFITKGDNNGGYDQANGIARNGPVKPEWISGVARVRIPYLGCIRLGLGPNSCFSPGTSTSETASITRSIDPATAPSGGAVAADSAPAAASDSTRSTTTAPDPARTAATTADPGSATPGLNSTVRRAVA